MTNRRPHLPTVLSGWQRNIKALDEIHDHHPFMTVCTQGGSIRILFDLRGGTAVCFFDEFVAAGAVQESGTAPLYDGPPNSGDRTLDRLALPWRDPKPYLQWFVLAGYLVVRHGLFLRCNRTISDHNVYTHGRRGDSPDCDGDTFVTVINR
ncbi:hypothetical protein [Halocatena salina]|uniref:Uncharacterized protein n=1 Tax=Halocatena salina TaxID=2934340 RepID=A0A8U0A300_9EURY|nr:hypothetical protein [Halocatena salina]UPM43424.1 hypothetical protein MW046_03010 [Halocatena salina]